MSAEALNPFEQFVELYADDPVAFSTDILGMTPDEWQADMMRAVAAGERRITIASGHGVGKTAVLATLAIWAVVTKAPCKVIMTAPSGATLDDGLLAETKTWMKRLPDALFGLFFLGVDRIELLAAPEEVFISARTSREEKPDALQGIHAAAGFVLLIADEAPGIPEAVFEAASGSMSQPNACTLLTGNPTRSSGFFWNTHNKAGVAERWWKRVVSCVEAVRTGRVSQDYIDDMAANYGEDSNVYRARVLGLFPKSDDDTVISLESVEGAIARDIEASPTTPRVWGVDVARFGDDRNALAKRQGPVVTEAVKSWGGVDLMQTAGRVKLEWDITPAPERPVAIYVDSIGLGAGVADRLRELGLPVRDVNVSESPSVTMPGEASYANLRAQLWFRGRAWLSARNCKLPATGGLRYELTVPRYKIASNGALQVESKDELKRRKVKSPNEADAFLLTFAEEASILAGGSSFSSNWKTALKRRIKGIV